jgi:hypothetical protein
MTTENPTATASLGRALNFAAGTGNAVVARLDRVDRAGRDWLTQQDQN